MKSSAFRTLTTASLLTAMAGIATARATDTPPAPAADPPAQLPANQHDDAMAEQASPAFLGVHATPVGLNTAKRLNLAPNTGLRLVAVVPGSAAELAGVVPGDVLSRLDDQLMVNPQQLAVLVQNKRPGDSVTLSVIRDGEPIELWVELGQRPQPQALQRAMPNALPGQLPHALRDGRHIDPLAPDLVGPVPPGDMAEVFEQMRERMLLQNEEMDQMIDRMRREMRIGQDAWHLIPPIDGPGHAVQSNVVVIDGEHHIQLKSNGASRHLIVKAIDGELLFDGEIPEDGVIDALPEAVQNKVKGLLNQGRIKRRIEPAPRQRMEPNGPVA